MEKQALETLLKELTLDEKIGMIHGNTLFETKGVERLHIPPLKTSDGPMGCRQEYQSTKWFPIGFSFDYTSYLPSNTALAATWNTELAYETGKVLGKEARGRGKDMILAPGINIHRSPLCGRNFEYMGEDPHLASELVVPLIQGIEENDVSSCVKHYALNNQETRRIDVEVEASERALREIYLPAFKAAVTKAKAKAVMGAYNKYKGRYCCQSPYLLDEILRKEWGFEGIVISDWGAVHDTKEAAETSIDIEMSVTDNFDEYFMAEPLKQAVLNGEVPESAIDEKVRHILYVMNELHMLDGERNRGMYNDIADREKLLKVADESVVLLKNEQNQLPLARKDGMHILVIGDNAERAHSNGGGSAEIKALYEITPLLGITMQAGGNIRVTYEQGYNARTKGRIWDPDNHTEESWQATSLEEGADTPQSKAAQFDEELAQRAVEAAKEADVVIFVGGLNHDYDTEGKDNESMKLPYAQDELINRLLEVREDMVIVMMTGSPVDMSAWVDKAATLLHMSYAGMEGGTALARVLFGDVNPSGKLPETFPRILEESPAHVLGNFPGDDFVNYGEDIFVGYRYFDTYNVKPLFAFGHGKSYTTFAMKDMRVIADEGASHTVKVTVENVGHMAGAEIVQLYVSDEECSVKRPKKELKAFTKVFLQPGESKEVTLTLTEESFGYYDENRACFVAESGVYVLGVGDASDNIMLTEKITLQNEITYK